MNYSTQFAQIPLILTTVILHIEMGKNITIIEQHFCVLFNVELYMLMCVCVCVVFVCVYVSGFVCVCVSVFVSVCVYISVFGCLYV